MRRHARPYHFGRLRVSKLTRTLKDDPQVNWPQHLQLANQILRNELRVPARTARRIVINSMARAHVCTQAIDERALVTNRYKSRIKARKSFSRLAACVTRAPASVRNSLDKTLHNIIPMKVDSEVIDEIIDAAHEIFLHSAKHEAGQTALRALDVRWLDGQQIIGLKTDYSALEAATRRKCESAISSLTRASVSGSAVAVFEALASAIDKDPPSGIPADVSDLIVTYVAVVATLWRRIGLRPSRATHPENPKYKSRFHRFVELVLTAMTEPWSNRHSHDIDQIARGAWAAHARLAPEIRTKISARLRREDREWLVSEDHVRKALLLPTQKTGRDTP